VYQQIIEKVIQTSQNDFEESGVDHTTLDEMKQVCCNLASISASAPCSPCSPLSQHYHELHYPSFSHLSHFLSNYSSHPFRSLRQSRGDRLGWVMGG
jgi:hypothetical protein